LVDLKKNLSSEAVWPNEVVNRHLVGSILVRSFIKIAHLVPIRLQTLPPKAILVSDCLISKKIFYSKTTLPNESKHGRKHPWKVSIKIADLVLICLINMAATGNSCF
jgi:hypothetical protein